MGIKYLHVPTKWNVCVEGFFLCVLLFPDVIKEVINQQSTLYDNVTIVANFFKYEQVSITFVRQTPLHN